MTMGKVNTVGGDRYEQLIWKNPDFVDDETRNTISNKTFNRATPRWSGSKSPQVGFWSVPLLPRVLTEKGLYPTWHVWEEDQGEDGRRQMGRLRLREDTQDDHRQRPQAFWGMWASSGRQEIWRFFTYWKWGDHRGSPKNNPSPTTPAPVREIFRKGEKYSLSLEQNRFLIAITLSWSYLFVCHILMFHSLTPILRVPSFVFWMLCDAETSIPYPTHPISTTSSLSPMHIHYSAKQAPSGWTFHE